MPRAWSELVADRYDLRLPPDLCAWLDDEVGRKVADERFEPLPAEDLLELRPGILWGGFMLPDTLPLVSASSGDWLCARVNQQGEITEYIYWSHAGGDWIPFGQTLAEALIFLTGDIYRAPHDAGWWQETSQRTNSAVAEWALDWLHEDQRPAPFWRDADVDAWQACEAVQLGSNALHSQGVLRALDNTMRRDSNPHTARQLGFDWEPDYVRWLFDRELTPPATRDALSRHFGASYDQLAEQDWQAAEGLADQTLRRRPDLAWAADIAGWGAERRGDKRQATDRYWQGLEASLFTDHCVSFRTHWFPEGMGKFVAFRLFELRAELTQEQRNSPYLQLFWENDPESLRSRVRDYWLALGADHEQHGRYWDAYQAYFRAGWDLGLQFAESYLGILDAMARTAQKAHVTSLAKLARQHRQCVMVH